MAAAAGFETIGDDFRGSGIMTESDEAEFDAAMSAEVGCRYNAGKPRLFFNSLGIEVQRGEAAVWGFGATKYAPGNWLKGMAFTEGADSLRRHLDAFLNGQDFDPETGLPEVDHIVCCAKILSNSFHVRKDLDDRPKK